MRKKNNYKGICNQLKQWKNHYHKSAGLKKNRKTETFSFVPHETPLVTFQQNTDLDHLNTCGIGFFNKNDR